tara:strand:- start:630 stop:887 length:258 start_codon:yes stop_codon:yes gene_type:complete
MPINKIEYTKTLILSSLITFGLLCINNKSNYPTSIYVPLLVALLVKYILGDWDKGYKWTYLDLFYWTFIIAFSYFIVKLFEAKSN